MVINAPYNFVPLAEQVVIPEWGKQVSHDLPFRDGLSGEIALTILTQSAILVGDAPQAATVHQPGQVHFFQTPDKRYAIPGSSLRGMVRNVLEIATFSRMGAVDDKSYGLRDISGKYVKEAYTDRVRNNVLYGFLRLDGQGKPQITPCNMVRLDHRELENRYGIAAPIFKAGSTVRNKYQVWRDLCHENNIIAPYDFKFSCKEGQVTDIGASGDQSNGFPVFTGQISAEKPDDQKFGQKYKGRPKYSDFVFYPDPSKKPFLIEEIDSTAWRNFLFIHGDEDSKPGMPWPDYWRNCFWQNKPVPVFYIQSKNRLQIGLAYMPKLAGDFSIHDMIRHTSNQHLANNGMDFAALMFGQVGDQPEDALKGRVFFEPAFLQGTGNPEQNPKPTILNGAKPSYFPNYIRQNTDKSGGKLASDQYATYIDTPANHAPELRGWKRYPARPKDEVKVQGLNDEQQRNKKVQTRLHTLPKDSNFSGRVVFHNLKPVELGALLWSLQLDGKRHGVGMGKSFGYGQVTVNVSWNTALIACNDPDQTPKATAADYMVLFQDYMTEQLGSVWHNSLQIQSLLAMSAIDDKKQFAGELKHMVMMGKNNEFVQAKQAGAVLAPYVQDLRKPKRGSNAPPTSATVSTKAIKKEVFIDPEIWDGARIKFNRANGTLSVDKGGKIANALQPKGEELINTLPSDIKRKVMTNQFVKVGAEVLGKEVVKVWV